MKVLQLKVKLFYTLLYGAVRLYICENCVSNTIKFTMTMNFEELLAKAVLYKILEQDSYHFVHL